MNFVYELTATVILEITLCYWLIVFPFFVWGPEWPDPNPKSSVKKSPQVLRQEKAVLLTFLALAHTIPALVILVDLRWSAIQFYPKHFWLLLIFAIAYICYFLVQEFVERGYTERPIYPSHDWHNHPI